MGRRIGQREVDIAVRLAPDRLLGSFVPRLAAMGLDESLIRVALRRVRRSGDWSDAWMWAAQRALGSAREGVAGGDAAATAHGKRQAALAFHAATWPPPDERTLRALRGSAAALFAEALPHLDPPVERIDVAWRTHRLPALLAIPPGDGPFPLAVVLNGLTTAKEETIAWRGPFLARGTAVLALDGPGAGEAAARLPATGDCLDLLDGVADLAEGRPMLDIRRIAAVGISVGGALAIRLGQADRRVRAVVAVTPPFDGRAWLHQHGPWLRAHVAGHAGGVDRLVSVAGELTLVTPAGRWRPPVLVFGAGADLIVPPTDAVRAAGVLGDDATLVWRRASGHAVFDDILGWTADAADWLAVVLDSESTRVDDVILRATR